MNKKVFAKFLFDNKMQDSQILKQAGITQLVLNIWKLEWNKKAYFTSAENLKYHSDEYKEWRAACFARDGKKCVLCGSKGRKNNPLQVDHIKSYQNNPELRFDVSNGRVVCRRCHSKLPTTKTYKKLNSGN